jgi:tetratricopeptide (TPR) repeat protein
MYSRIALPLLNEGRLDEAVAVIDEAVEMHRRLGQEHELSMALQLAGVLSQEQGDLTKAADAFEESIARSREFGDLQLMERTLLLLAMTKRATGEVERSFELVRVALQIAWRHRDLITVAMCFVELANALSASSDTRAAARFWGAAERLDEELGPSQFRSEKHLYEQFDPAVLADEEGIAAGKALATAEVVELALRVK